MRKIINIVLIIVSVISLIVVLKLSSIPVICFPKIFVSTSEVRETYSLVYDICLGLLLSTLFYFIVNVIPEYIKIKKSKKFIHSYIEQILQYMNQIISISLSLYGRDNIQLNNIAIKDLKVLNDTNNYANKEISYSLAIFNMKNERITGIRQYNTLNELVKSSISEIHKNLEYTKKYEYIYAVNEKMLEILKKIDGCGLIKCYDKKEKNDTDCYILSHTDKEMYEFISLYRLLEKQKYHNKYSVITLDTEDETIKYRNQRNNGELINYCISCNDKRVERYNYYKPALIISDSYSSNLVKDKFCKNIPFETYKIDDITAEEIKSLINRNTKLLIIIVSKEKVKSFTKLLNQIDTSIKVFIISEYEFIKRHYSFKVALDNIDLQKRYSYLKSKYIFNNRVLLHKEHPRDNEIDIIVNEINSYMLDGVDYNNI